MAEIKTCEQYVLCELENTRAELELLKLNHEGLQKKFDALLNEFNELTYFVRTRGSYDDIKVGISAFKEFDEYGYFLLRSYIETR